jgi:NADH-quinone oxidoreductase subunit E
MFKLGFHNPDDELADKIALNTSDGQYTIRTVACFGQCALAPVVEVNHEVYGHMNEQTLQRELKHLGRETAKK